MFNIYKYIQQRTKILSRLFWFQHKVEIDNDHNIIKVTVSKGNKSKVLIIGMLKLTNDIGKYKDNINMGLLHLYFSLVEEIFNEYK